MGTDNETSDLLREPEASTGRQDVSAENLHSAVPNPKRKRKPKPNPKRPLDRPEDEAIAQYMSAPKSFRDFKSLTELALQFKISRMTVYRRSKDSDVLDRISWLSRNHRLAGNLLVQANWDRIVEGQVKAAVAGNTKAAQFCIHVAWAEDPMLKLFD